MKKLTQRGDTIVEVLIAMLVISVILGGAFVTTNNSQTAVRDSQEHGEALKLVESQLEQLRGNASSSSPTVFPPVLATGTPFCMYNNAPVSSATNPTAADCIQNSSGTPTTTEPAYHLSISSSSSNGGYLFMVTASWYEVNGNGMATETMAYRLYQ
jgi:prepilin-type N-terminal cleavage/methylation domain-containing protein